MYNIKCKDCNFIFNHNARNKRYCDHCTIIRYNNNQKKHIQMKQDKKLIPDPHKIQCLICYRYYRKPMSHAWQVHGTTAREYKDNYNLEQKGLIPEHDREILKQHIKDNYSLVVERNLINNPKSQQKRFKSGKAWDYNYKRQPATLARLKAHAKVVGFKLKNK